MEGVVLRPPRPGDISWAVQRQAVSYAAEFGWGLEFEALACGIAADFIRGFKPGLENCWIACMGGHPVGAVFCVQAAPEVARLRMLVVEPEWRGRGIGARLVGECIEFARNAGYRRIVLWTNDLQEGARRIYGRAGFVLVHREVHRTFGGELAGETWERDL